MHPGWGTNTTSCIPTSFTPSPSLQDKADIESLLSPENVNRDALLSYAKEAANFSTNYRLPELEFALNHRDLPDVDMFDFTCMTRSENAALVREHNGSRLLIGLVGDCLVEVRVPLAAPPPASVSPLPARSLGCNIFHLPEHFSSPLPGAPHPQVPAGGCFGGLIPFPSPTRDLGGGGVRVEEQPSSSPDASTPVAASTQPWGWGGDSHPSPPCASCRRSPLSSLAKPGSSLLLPAAPTGCVAPAPSLSAFPLTALLAAGHRCGQGLPRRLRRSVDGAAVGGRDPPAGGVGREVSVPVLLGWSLDQARMVALSPALSLAPRESIYQHLSQTSPDNTNKNISQYSIDPATRYPNINLQAFKPNQVPGPGLAMGHPSSPASPAVGVTPILMVPLSPKALRLKLLVPRAFNALPVADVGGSGEVGGCAGVPLAGGTSLHWL